MPTDLPQQAFQPSGLPRYLEIANVLHAEISRGTWAVGEQLPSNKALADRFEVTPVTAREAVKFLEKRGVVASRRGAGTFVVGGLPRHQSVTLKSNMQAVVDQIGNGRLIPVSINDGKTGPILPAHLHAAKNYQRIIKLSVREDKPIMVSDVWLAKDVYDEAVETFEIGPILPQLTAMFQKRGGLTRAYQVMTIESAHPEVAEALKLMPWSPLACMQIIMKNNRDEAIYIVDLKFPGETIRVEFDLEQV